MSRLRDGFLSPTFCFGELARVFGGGGGGGGAEGSLLGLGRGEGFTRGGEGALEFGGGGDRRPGAYTRSHESSI